ncbi:response regulator transcription factor [Paenibacillus polysaccharolyticus]|jgi:DNA-binding response OmpR family regulator|uniref:response regulator transcription factor n=1 Tax=Paenibacillus TaxID=44249 RepID=UPI0012B76011|nr:MULTISPECIES: response regulator transcription factor [Paenibacillus]
MKRNLLLVDDEPRIRHIVAEYFVQDGWEVIEAGDGGEALSILKKERVDLMIMDIMMPKMDGWSLCREIRKYTALPIIILTAKSDEEDMIKGYDLGADEFVSKPFSPKVLLARSKILIKRVEGRLLKAVSTDDYKHDEVLRFEGLWVDPASRKVWMDNILLHLRPKEYSILLYLIQNRGIALSREKILDFVWGLDFDGELRVIDTHIGRVRAKLGRYGHYIHTISGYGYRFEVNS